MKSLTIGEVAKQANIGVETVRFYERRGLLAEPDRKASGYRQYEPSAVARLQFIRQSKELGFRLTEIKELLSLWFDPCTQCCDVRKKSLAKIVEIDERIESLKAMKTALTRITIECKRRGSLAECPLFTELKTSSPRIRPTRKRPG
jgi:MerR family transcriptional regulator, copper efflux regulator